MIWRRKTKVFGIGRNKTGTTSLGRALKNLGWKLAPQPPAQLLIEEWGRRDFRPILRFCRKYDAFQDVPFSLPFTYVVLDHSFPGSRFVLTVRDNAGQWFESLIRHRPADLLILNVADPHAMERLCAFVGVEFRNQKMPHLQSSARAEEKAARKDSETAS